ncbi:MAG: STAS domain-containing protein [Planctomycetota bacterium]|nr:STAS domain-containing protein [Planctomycetota bacterium]
MVDELAIEIDARPAGTVVRLKGCAGIHEGPVLERALTRICAGKPCLLILDMSQLTMIASLALGQMVAVKKTMERTGGKIRLAAVSPPVMGTLRHARLDSIFPCFATVEEALIAA